MDTGCPWLSLPPARRRIAERPSRVVPPSYLTPLDSCPHWHATRYYIVCINHLGVPRAASDRPGRHVAAPNLMARLRVHQAFCKSHYLLKIIRFRALMHAAGNSDD